MVERSGQPFAVGCLPLLAVFHPVTFYRPTVESLAVVPEKQIKDTAEMLFKFLLSGEHRLKIAIRAKSETQARQLLHLNKAQAVCFARIKGGVYA